mmetsp:Transcript_6897/g.9659  ORF Transcript_6897/g.9659 Transcript_6897/m.9659 type:complete len:257 (+) Transcript_6897:25-795(+)
MVKKRKHSRKSSNKLPFKKKIEKKSLTETFERKLHGSQFRSLNEELYTKSGEENFDRFTKNPWLAEAYHRGYREQTLKWPINPLDEMISFLKKMREKGRKEKLVVADMGCGEGRLATELNTKFQVFSFDLIATKPHVIACNIARTPLPDASVDFVIFSLSLMGPSFWDFLREAYRILKPNGFLRIAEVRSRFDEQRHGFDAFENGLKALGFDKESRQTSSKMFVSFLFTKSSSRLPKPPSFQAFSFSLKPCLYKRR